MKDAAYFASVLSTQLPQDYNREALNPLILNLFRQAQADALGHGADLVEEWARAEHAVEQFPEEVLIGMAVAICPGFKHRLVPLSIFPPSNEEAKSDTPPSADPDLPSAA